MPVIHIFGAAGSGTSTLGHALHERFGYSQIDTDDFFWLPTDPPFTRKRPVEERVTLITGEIAKYRNVVISGSLCGWGDVLIPRFDLVIRLSVPVEVRLSRIKEREFRRFGEHILPNGDMYHKHQKFLLWSSEYDTGNTSMRSKAMHDEWQSKLTCRCLTLNGPMPIDKLINQIGEHFTF